jgi:hypothetical protein
MGLVALLKRIYRLRHEVKLALGTLVAIERGALRTIPDDSPADVTGPETLIVPKARFISQDCPTENSGSVEIAFPEIKIYALENARLVGTRAMPMTQSRRLVTEHTYGRTLTMLSTQATLKPFLLIRKSLSKPLRRTGRFFSINSPYAFNYFHWVTDCLPCIRTYESLTVRPTLLVPNGLSEWQSRYLALLGYDATSYEEFTADHLQVAQLLIPSWHKLANPYMPPAPSTLRWLRDRTLVNIEPSSKETPTRIFVGRADSNKARFGNEAEIAHLLRRYAFEYVILGGMKLDDQLNTFRNAKIVIGLHGAGLTNIIYSSKPVVLEICQAGSFFPYFSALTAATCGEHYAYAADHVDAAGSSCVDLAGFESAVGSLLAELHDRNESV